MAKNRKSNRNETPGFEEELINIWRCSTVVKGGRRFSFAAAVVVGDGKGTVGWGYGKAREVPAAIEKATKEAHKNLAKISLLGSTIPHEIQHEFCSAKVLLMPASEGTGVIACSAVRKLCQVVGIHNILTKVYGSTNQRNVVRSAYEALCLLRSKEQVAELRGVEL